MLQYSNRIFYIDIKLLSVHLLLCVKKTVKNANIPDGQKNFERKKS